MVTYPTTTTTADEILNTVAAEVGLEEVSDPVGSEDASYKQLVRLLNVAGDELSVMNNWEVLRREHTFTTAAADVGNYALPTDFTHIVDSTVWDRTEDEPMFGPLSAQEWQALLGEDTTTISTLGWRIMGGEFYVYPYNPVGLIRAVYFEYVSNNWIVATNGTTYKNKVTVNSDVILYNRPHVLGITLDLKPLKQQLFLLLLSVLTQEYLWLQEICQYVLTHIILCPIRVVCEFGQGTESLL